MSFDCPSELQRNPPKRWVIDRRAQISHHLRTLRKWVRPSPVCTSKILNRLLLWRVVTKARNLLPTRRKVAQAVCTPIRADPQGARAVEARALAAGFAGKAGKAAAACGLGAGATGRAVVDRRAVGELALAARPPCVAPAPARRVARSSFVAVANGYTRDRHCGCANRCLNSNNM